MFTVTYTGSKSGTMSVRFADARKALKAFRQMELDGASNLSITDNRLHQPIDVAALEAEARQQESAPQ